MAGQYGYGKGMLRDYLDAPNPALPVGQDRQDDVQHALDREDIDQKELDRAYRDNGTWAPNPDADPPPMSQGAKRDYGYGLALRLPGPGLPPSGNYINGKRVTKRNAPRIRSQLTRLQRVAPWAPQNRDFSADDGLLANTTNDQPYNRES